MCVINSWGMALHVPLYSSQKGFTQINVSIEILTIHKNCDKEIVKDTSPPRLISNCIVLGYQKQRLTNTKTVLYTNLLANY